MSWVRVEDHFPENPKVVGLTDRAFRVYVVALCYSNRNLTDGLLTPNVQRNVGATPKIASELVRSGLWEMAGSGAVFIHDYFEYQFSKAEILSRRSEQHAGKVAGGKARAATAVRNGGRFTSTSPAALLVVPPAGAPAAHQPRTQSRTQASIDAGTTRRTTRKDAEGDAYPIDLRGILKKMPS